METLNSLEDIAQRIAACSKCALREGATQPVPGIGDIGAKYFLLGEGPGQEEDKRGIPFIGAAGKKLNELMALGGISPNDCYFSNTVRCRPPKNRDPKKKELKCCAEYLFAEIRLVKPQYLIALGRVPLSLFTDEGVSKLHGTMFEYELEDTKFTLIAQYHPAACLHNPRLWSVMLNDWATLPVKADTSYYVTDTPDPNTEILAMDTENDVGGVLGAWSVVYRDSEGKLCATPYHGTRRKAQFTAPVIFHNAKWDIRVLRRNKMPVPKQCLDTMIAAYCMGFGQQAPSDSSLMDAGNMTGGLGLKYLARRHLGMEMDSWKETIAKGELGDMAEYNIKDSLATYLLFEKWRPDLPQHFWDIDMPLLGVCMDMEDRGVQIDKRFLSEYSKLLDEQIAEIGDLPLNPNSSSEVQSYLFGTLGLEPLQFTKNTGAPTVTEELLEGINDPLVKKILQKKRLVKEKGTYVDNYTKNIDKTGRLHCEFKQTRTSTGRLACASPNLQNVKKGTRLRELFIAPEGMSLIRVDWQQLEFAVLAAMTQDPKLIAALTAGKKIHQVVADALGQTYDDGKTSNFLTIYGGKAWTLAQRLGITIDAAEQFQKDYLVTFPAIGQYMEEQRAKAREDKKVTNWFGRVRRLDAMYSDKFRVLEEGEREAINTPIQGTAGEIVKRAMIDLFYNHSAPVILQVHDELIFEIEDKDTVEYAHWLKDYLPTLTEINGVRFSVDVGIGKNWAAAAMKENQI